MRKQSDRGSRPCGLVSSVGIDKERTHQIAGISPIARRWAGSPTGRVCSITMACGVRPVRMWVVVPTASGELSATRCASTVRIAYGEVRP